VISFVDYLSSRTRFMMRVAALAAGEDDLWQEDRRRPHQSPDRAADDDRRRKNAALLAKWNLAARSAMSPVTINGVP
jgi:hypothetical protein